MVKVVMVLAQGPGLPEGSVEDRIEMRVRLTSQGRLDRAAWEADPQPWRATHRRGGRREPDSELVWSEERWALHPPGGDAPIWVLDASVIRPGEIVTVSPPEGGAALFRIVAVEQD
jgi:hypothetical protein